MFGRKQKLEPRHFGNTVNSQFRQLAAMSFCEKNNNTPEDGLKLFWKDINRGTETVCLGEEQIPIPSDITIENFKALLIAELGDQYNSFLRHYSQRPMLYCGTALTAIPKGVDNLTPEAREQFLGDSIKIPFKDQQSRATTHIYYDPREKAVHVKTTDYVLLSNFFFGQYPQEGEREDLDKAVEVVTDFRLLQADEEVANKDPTKSKKGFMFVSLETPSELCARLFASPKADVERSFSFSSKNEIGSQHKIPDEQQEPVEKGSVFWKIVKGVSIIVALIGIGLLVAASLYLLPPVALTLPYLGTLLSASPLAFAGAGCLGAAGTGLLFNSAATSEWFMEKWRQVSLFWKGGAGVSTGFGIGATVAGAVLFPPLIYAGLGLVLITAVGHLLHILLQKPPEPEAPEPRLVSEKEKYEYARNSLSSTGESVLRPSPFLPKVSSRAGVGSITPEDQPEKIPAGKSPDKKGEEKCRLFTSPTAGVKKDLTPEFRSPSSADDASVRPPLKTPDSEQAASSDDAYQSPRPSLSWPGSGSE